MRTFVPQNPSWADSLRDYGFGDFVDQNTGERVLVTHSSSEGTLTCLRGEKAATLPRPDLVVCCYPARVAARYPLRVWGDWDTPTHLHVEGGLPSVCSKEEWEAIATPSVPDFWEG